MKKKSLRIFYIFSLLVIFNFNVYAQWKESDKEIKEGMTSVKISESDTKTKGVIISSDDLNGNLSLIYIATIATEQLIDLKNFKEFTYGYEKESQKFVAIKANTENIIYIENDSEEKLLKSIDSLIKANFKIKK